MKNKGKNNKQAYFIGLKGVGMTMLAQFLKTQGWTVSGSDICDRFLTDAVLHRHGISVFSPFSAKNIPDKIDLIVHSSAFNAQNNPELEFIAHHPEIFSNISVLSYAEALGTEFNRYLGVAVCGSHGKTTTTAWLGYVLSRAGLSPNVLVGSNVEQFKGSGLSGTSRYLVAEVDEYQNKMRFFSPVGVLLNNVDYDHPDFFKTKAAYNNVFKQFIKKIPVTGWLVVNFDDKVALSLARNCAGQVITYSLVNHQADYVATNLKISGARLFFKILYKGRSQGEFYISLAGRHNVSNALAVVAASRQLGVSWVEIKNHLGGFQGTDRRCQVLGKYQGATIIDDYAHHPAEIKATLSALRAKWPHDRLITVFHPHTFSRTQALFSDFVTSFLDTDELIVLDVYSSAREKATASTLGTSRQLVEAISSFNKEKGRKQLVKAIPKITQAATFLRSRLKPNDRLILMGAGDVFRLADQLLKKVEKKKI